MRALMLTGWSFEPYAVAGLFVGGIWYVAGLIRMRHNLGPARITTRAQTAAFGAGLVTLILALLSPLDMLGEQLFSAHMVQHLLLMLAAPPLLVWSRPVIVLLWALPRAGRKGAGRAWTGFGRTGVDALMHPLVVWLLFDGSFVFWHCPGPYTWALRNEFVQAAEHLCFFVTALMFWSIVLDPAGRRRLGYGATLVFVMTSAVLSGLPGALMILASRPLYPVHQARVADWGLTLMQDQQLAGLVMWIPAGLVYVAAASYMFVNWLEASEPPLSAVGKRPALLTVPLVFLVPLLSGCDRGSAKAFAASVGSAKDGAKIDPALWLRVVPHHSGNRQRRGGRRAAARADRPPHLRRRPAAQHARQHDPMAARSAGHRSRQRDAGHGAYRTRRAERRRLSLYAALIPARRTTRIGHFNFRCRSQARSGGVWQ